MKILITNTGSWGTGSGMVVKGVLKELLRLGHEVRVVYPDLKKNLVKGDVSVDSPLYEVIDFPREYKGEEFDTFPLMIPDPNPRVGDKVVTYRDMSEGQLAAFRELLIEEFSRVIREFDPDVIETQHVWLMGEVLADLGCKYVAVAHNSDQIGFRYDKRMQPYAIECAKKADYIFAISDFVRDEVMDLYGVCEDKVPVIHNGYDDEIFKRFDVDKESLFKEFGLDVDLTLPVVTFGGKLSKTKGIDVLLKANEIIQKKNPYLLLLFGAGGFDQAMGRQPTEEEMKNVVLLGHVDQEILAQFHNVSKFSVLPSREEGFSIAALEAMGCGLPMVGTKTGQLEKFIVGEVVKPGSVSELAEAIQKMLLAKDADIEKLSQRAVQEASKYSWKDNVKKRLEYYNRL